MADVRAVEVRLWGNRVGAVAPLSGKPGFYEFQYAPAFVQSGLELSPLRMPLSENRRYSFTDLTRLAKVDVVTRRALTGHVTEQMQRHYSTVDVAEKREAMEAAMGVLKAAKAEAERKKSVNSGVN